MTQLRYCLRDPIPELYDAARYLDAAVSAHLQGYPALAMALIKLADQPAVREWTESLWGKGGPWTRPVSIDETLPSIPEDQRAAARTPSTADKAALVARDGHHCKFCGIPLVREEVRKRMSAAYPTVLPWGRTNASQHAGLQALWLHTNFIVPHSRGGAAELANLVVACAPCTYGRYYRTLAEVGLADPRSREPMQSQWDGLERFR